MEGMTLSHSPTLSYFSYAVSCGNHTLFVYDRGQMVSTLQGRVVYFREDDYKEILLAKKQTKECV